MKFGFGQALRRKEDEPLLRGQGRYVADVTPPGSLHAVVLRSPHAHARFAIHDLARVRAMQGVRLILTAADVAHLNPMPCPGTIPDLPIEVPDYPVLARDIVRHVGDAVAFVVADTLALAKDAAEAITVDWQPLPHVIGVKAALAPGAPPVHAGRGNLAFETAVGDQAATRAAFAQAAHKVEVTVVNQRLVTNYLDTRGVIAEHDGNALHAHHRQPGQPHHPRHHRRHGDEAQARRDARHHATTSAAASAPSCFPIANTRSPRSPPSACASR